MTVGQTLVENKHTLGFCRMWCTHSAQEAKTRGSVGGSKHKLHSRFLSLKIKGKTEVVEDRSENSKNKKSILSHI